MKKINDNFPKTTDGFWEMTIEREFKRIIKHPGLTRDDMEKFIDDFLAVGFFAGKLAGWLIRWYNGKPIVYKYPDKPKISQTRKSIQNRGSMSTATRFAAAVNSIPLLKEIWDKAPLEGNCAYRKLIKFQKNCLINNLPSINNTLTPEYISIFADHKISFDGRSTVNIDYNSDVTENDKIVLLLVAYNPDNQKFEMLKLHDGAPVSEIKLDEEQIIICNKYKKYILYTAVINNGEYSNTITAEGEFEYENESEKLWLIIYFLGKIISREFNRPKPYFINKAHPPPGKRMKFWVIDNPYPKGRVC